MILLNLSIRNDQKTAKQATQVSNNHHYASQIIIQKRRRLKNDL